MSQATTNKPTCWWASYYSGVPRPVGRTTSTGPCKIVSEWEPILSLQGWCSTGRKPLQRRPFFLIPLNGSLRRGTHNIPCLPTLVGSNVVFCEYSHVRQGLIPTSHTQHLFMALEGLIAQQNQAEKSDLQQCPPTALKEFPLSTLKPLGSPLVITHVHYSPHKSI